MEKKKATLQSQGLVGKFREAWSHNSMVSTLFALLVMILIQAVVQGINAGSFTGMFGKMWIAWLNILRNNTYAGVIALGMCFAIISGGIDLSVGSTLCAIGAALLYMLDEANGPLAAMGITGIPAYIIAILAAVLMGALMGSMNGALIAYGKLPPFIATLGTMKIFRSVTQQLTQQFNPSVPAGFKAIASTRIGNQIILPIIYWVVMVIIMHIILRRLPLAVRPSPSVPTRRLRSFPVSMLQRSS